MKFVINYNDNLIDHNKHWQFCVGSCHAPLAHRADYIKQLSFIYSELGIKRVRFHGLFNEDMNVGLSLKNIIPLKGAKQYRQISFYQIGCIYDNILSTGMKPFVELSFMPEILASGKRKCAFKYRGNITMPKSLEEWSEFIKSFISFLINRYGKEEVESWYFEVWNEPNLLVFFKGKMKDYFKLYEATAKAIKNVSGNIKVGGPSTAACAWIQEFMNFVQANNVPCDFISTHQYPGEPLGHSLSIMSEAKNLFRRYLVLRKNSGTVLQGIRTMLRDKSELEEIDGGLFTTNAAALKPAVGSLPLFITEWNVTSTCSAPINDTKKASSYIIQTVLESEKYVDGTSFWSFSDIFEELQFFPEPFSGSFGLLNIHGIPKPSFYAFKLLSMLGDKRYPIKNTSESVKIAAFRKDNIIQVIIYNQSFKQNNNTKETVTVQINEVNKPKEVIVYAIDDNHCNPYEEWQKLGAPMYLKPNDVEKIKELSNLRIEKINYAYSEGTITINTDICDNDIKLIIIE